MPPCLRILRAVLTLAVVTSLCLQAHAAEHITLRSGAEFNCTHHETAANRTRLYLASTSATNAPALAAQQDESYIDVSAASILRVEILPNPSAAPPPTLTSSPASQPLNPIGLHQLLTQASTQHNIDADLLASIVHAESNGNPRALSRAGAQGLMQLMPSTASTLGVLNSFAPDQNISGGSTYLDQLLTRYHNDIALAVAAYNAGPAAVDHYHGIPPYAETRAYVARVIREFNRRKRLANAPAPRLQLKAQLLTTRDSKPSPGANKLQSTQNQSAGAQP